jgi:ParB/RepB/Spo0J family partition protein
VKIVYKSVTQITPYENNPRVNDKAVEAVAASIKEFGFKQPIVVDSQGVIVAGHTRYKAALSLGMDKVPVLVADDLTDEQVKAYRLADNKTAELAEWDFSALQEELDALDMDMEMFGFSDAAFDDVVADKNESEYDDSEDETVTCPNCGLTFTP